MFVKGVRERDGVAVASGLSYRRIVSAAPVETLGLSYRRIVSAAPVETLRKVRGASRL